MSSQVWKELNRHCNMHIAMSMQNQADEGACLIELLASSYNDKGRMYNTG